MDKTINAIMLKFTKTNGAKPPLNKTAIMTPTNYPQHTSLQVQFCRLGLREPDHAARLRSGNWFESQNERKDGQSSALACQA